MGGDDDRAAVTSAHPAKYCRKINELALPFGSVAAIGKANAKSRVAAVELLRSIVGWLFSAKGLEHDPEKWTPVFGKDLAQTRT
ncbi:hypothetical protein [Rhodopseudomonas pseudopalustris]|uniref:hypothetical protein n=1 Tax=Rhodopseudomonas pseudopalustris TaxID=1513892 RepID=UPI0011135861|nr:hypothetical protein [Rhodopseudomonas pseudopalustris]